MVIDKCTIAYVCKCATVCSWAPPLSGFPIFADRDGNSIIQVQFLALSKYSQDSLGGSPSARPARSHPQLASTQAPASPSLTPSD